MTYSRKFSEEISNFTGKRITIETSEGRIYNGILVSIDENLNVIIENTGQNIDRMIINGSFVKEVKLTKPFDIKTFVEKLNNVFPGLVKVVENTIVVMDKIKVTEKGVEGSGLAVDRVKAMYEQFVRESK